MVKLQVIDDSSPLSQSCEPGAEYAHGNFRGKRHHCVAADLLILSVPFPSVL